VQIGTFSVVPEAMLSGLVLLPALWKHYAAAVIHAGLAVQTVPTDRAPRLAGTSRMSFTGLAMHGLTALSVFADRIGVRLLVTMATLTVLLTGALSALAILQLLAIVAVPSAVFVAGILAMMCVFQTGLAALMFVFTTERGGEPLAAPLHDYSLFVATCTRVHAADEVLSAGRVGA
jgi:hypothetical protein